jgi:hypothetical protein
MKHLKLYENFEPEVMPEIAPESEVHFETESSDIIPISGSEGNYKVTFQNSEGQDTTVEIGGAADPEFMGDSMVSSIEMIPDSSSDGKSYSITGYYDLVPGSHGAYDIKKVLIEEK